MLVRLELEVRQYGVSIERGLSVPRGRPRVWAMVLGS